MIEYSDDHYVSFSETATATATANARVGSVRVFQYQDFNNTKPLTFDGVQDPIITMRWLSDVEGCFFTCSCLAD